MAEFSEDQLPQEVVAELKRQSASPVTVPADFDAAILADARMILSRSRPRPQRSRSGWRKWTLGTMTVGSLAAGLLVAAVWPWGNRQQELMEERIAESSWAEERATADAVAVASVQVERAVSQDIDQNGRINILDAFALARQMDSSHSGDLSADQNGDGHLDKTDIDLIAMSAVTLR